MSTGFSPCETCIYNVCRKIFPATKWEPEERDEECTQDMASYMSSEGCYHYEFDIKY